MFKIAAIAVQLTICIFISCLFTWICGYYSYKSTNKSIITLKGAIRGD